MSGYRIPAGVHRVEDVVRRSRFIATLAHADSPEAAKAHIARVRAQFPDATHHCWAWQLGPPGDTARVRASDDSEPAGTAGRPMLAVLVGSGVGEVVAVVTRYFGGVKLGGGGLVRAYSSVVARAMATLPTVEKVRWRRLVLTVEYMHLPAVYRAVAGWGGRILKEDCAQRAKVAVLLPEPEVAAAIAWVQEVTAGRGRATMDDEEE